MRLLPPDLSSFIRAKLTSSKVTASPLDFSGTSNNSVGLPKSADLTKSINHISPSKVPEMELFGDSLLKHISYKSDQSSASIMTLIQSLGLPPDSLSSSIISFFKFFSLPLDVPVLKQIRREVLESKSSKDSISLAASAAFDKGVSLSDEALKEYAAAIDPAEHSGAHDDSGGTGFDQNARDDQQKRNKDDQSALHAEDLKNLMNEIDTNGSLLGYLNKIPGKNGQFWIVLPFKFISGLTEFSVSVRILLNTSDFHHSVERFTVDVLSNDCRWFFLVSKKNDDSYLVQTSVSPALNHMEQTNFVKELKEILGDFITDISFMDESVIESLFDSRNDSIISVDEEV